MAEIKLLTSEDGHVLQRVANDVFDHPVDGELAAEFLSNPHNHIAVFIEDGVIVGFASGIDYVHPDKRPQMWINEVGVAPSHQGRGIGRAVVSALIEHARERGCTEAWVLTDNENAAARGLYRAVGGTEQSSVMVTFPLDPETSQKSTS